MPSATTKTEVAQASENNKDCVNNIFTLASILQLYQRVKNKKMFAAFAGYKRVLDSVNHSLVYDKLYTLILINIIKNVYNQAVQYLMIFYQKPLYHFGFPR